jgi:hypothetical protein
MEVQDIKEGKIRVQGQGSDASVRGSGCRDVLELRLPILTA